MDEPIVLEVLGTPAPQGSKSAFRNPRTGRMIIVEGKGKGTERHAVWRRALSDAARQWQDEHRLPLLDEPVLLRCQFWLPRPASIPRWRWLCDKAPDADKLARTVGDALTGIVLRDDSRICTLIVSKEYAIGRPPGVRITVERLGAKEREVGQQQTARVAR